MTGDINEKIYSQLERQLSKYGAKTVFKGLRKTKRTLQQHQAKLPNLKYPSSVEKTIRNAERQIRTIEKFIADKGLKETTL